MSFTLGVPGKCTQCITEKGAEPQAVINCAGTLASVPRVEELQPDTWVSGSFTLLTSPRFLLPSHLTSVRAMDLYFKG